MASSILRKLSACRSSARRKIELGQLGDAIHAARHFFAEILLHIARRVTVVSSTTSCSRPVSMQTTSMRMSARMCATISGCDQYGSPESRSCPS